MQVKNANHIIHTLEALHERVPEAVTGLTEELLSKYPMAIPEYYLNLIDFSDENDPIMKMSVPSEVELQPDGVYDTSGEHENTIIEGLQHKYNETALILSTNKCAMYCRYCFRKRLVGVDNHETVHNIDNVVGYIQEHTEINNVLISGGDSLLNSNKKLEMYLERLCEIDHLDYIRFGTKIPIVLPQRILADEELQNLFRTYGQKKQLYVITQYNHPNELTEESIEAIRCLQSQGVVVKNQMVLLRGVNDSADTIAELFNMLTRIGIIPYYIFQCRPVAGVKNHFQVPIKEGIAIIDDVKRKTNGNAKGFRYVLSNEKGKLEILGQCGDKVLLKYHQAKDLDRIGVIFQEDLTDETYWVG